MLFLLLPRRYRHDLVDALGASLWHLATHPGRPGADYGVRAQHWLDTAIEEFLRFYGRRSACPGIITRGRRTSAAAQWKEQTGGTGQPPRYKHAGVSDPGHADRPHHSAGTPRWRCPTVRARTVVGPGRRGGWRDARGWRLASTRSCRYRRGSSRDACPAGPPARSADRRAWAAATRDTIDGSALDHRPVLEIQNSLVSKPEIVIDPDPRPDTLRRLMTEHRHLLLEMHSERRSQGRGRSCRNPPLINYDIFTRNDIITPIKGRRKLPN